MVLGNKTGAVGVSENTLLLGSSVNNSSSNAPDFAGWHDDWGGKGYPACKTGERRDRMSAVRRHSLLSFFVLAYALAWWVWILYAFDLTFRGPILALGPFLAAIN